MTIYDIKQNCLFQQFGFLRYIHQFNAKLPYGSGWRIQTLNKKEHIGALFVMLYIYLVKSFETCSVIHISFFFTSSRFDDRILTGHLVSSLMEYQSFNRFGIHDGIIGAVMMHQHQFQIMQSMLRTVQ